MHPPSLLGTQTCSAPSMVYFSVECYFWAICMHSSLQVRCVLHTQSPHTHTHTPRCIGTAIFQASSWPEVGLKLMSAGPVGRHRHKYYKTCYGSCKGEWGCFSPALSLPRSATESMHWVWPKCLPSAQINKPVALSACSCLALSLCLSVPELNCRFLANAFTGCKGLLCIHRKLTDFTSYALHTYIIHFRCSHTHS